MSRRKYERIINVNVSDSPIITLAFKKRVIIYSLWFHFKFTYPSWSTWTLPKWFGVILSCKNPVIFVEQLAFIRQVCLSDYLCFLSSKIQRQGKGLYKWSGLHGLFGIWIWSGRCIWPSPQTLIVCVGEGARRAVLSVWPWFILNSGLLPSLNPCYSRVSSLK